jgi:hypothetical protein
MFAGNQNWGYQVGKPGQLNQPKDMAFDASGLMYFADHDNNRVRTISPAGCTITFFLSLSLMISFFGRGTGMVGLYLVSW